LEIHCRRAIDEENSPPIAGRAIVVAVPSSVMRAEARINAARGTLGSSPMALLTFDADGTRALLV
jgi:hypothetical protein